MTAYRAMAPTTAATPATKACCVMAGAAFGDVVVLWLEPPSLLSAAPPVLWVLSPVGVAVGPEVDGAMTPPLIFSSPAVTVTGSITDRYSTLLVVVL